MTKYIFDFPYEIVEIEVQRLTNQLWKLIPMKENDEDWQRQLDNTIIEITGLQEIFLNNPLFLQLLAKLEGLRLSEDVEFSLYRKNVFDAINLLQEFKDERQA